FVRERGHLGLLGIELVSDEAGTSSVKHLLAIAAGIGASDVVGQVADVPALASGRRLGGVGLHLLDDHRSPSEPRASFAMAAFTSASASAVCCRYAPPLSWCTCLS